MANALLLEPLAMPSITASATAPGYAAGNMGSNASADFMGLVWNSGGGAATRTVTIDLGADRPLDTILLLGLAGAQASWDWAIALATSAQGPFSGSFWSGSAEDLLAGSVMPVSGLGKALWQKPGGAPASARYVRITFSVLGSAAVQVARIIVSRKIQLERNFSFGAALGVRPLGKVDFSPRGVLLRRRGRKLRGLGISFKHIYRDELEAAVQPLIERVGNDELLAIVQDPAADAQRQNRIWTGFLTGNLGSIWARPGGFQADFNMIALD